MQKAWQHWLPKVSSATRPWAMVRGPTTAVIATLRRLGWSFPAPGCFADELGNIMNLEVISAWELTDIIRDRTLQLLEADWIQKHGEAAGIKKGLFLEPVKALLRRGTNAHWTKAHRGLVRATYTGATWPQVRLCPQYSSTRLCQACGLSEGTERHRTFVCPARKGAREKLPFRDIVHRGASSRP